jgi:hypothetical protein
MGCDEDRALIWRIWEIFLFKEGRSHAGLPTFYDAFLTIGKTLCLGSRRRLIVLVHFAHSGWFPMHGTTPMSKRFFSKISF